MFALAWNNAKEVQLEASVPKKIGKFFMLCMHLIALSV
jgi:hypothetical protein